MNAYTNQKKLNMDPERKTVLTQALTEASTALSEPMRYIYKSVIHKLNNMPGRQDRILLTAAEIDTVKYALGYYESNHGSNDVLDSMRLQLMLTRKEYSTRCAG